MMPWHVSTDTPYQALFCRQPHILTQLEGGCYGDVDAQGHNIVRIRELAAAVVIEAIAEVRVARADGHQTAPALESSKHKVGDLVDVWYDPPNVDAPGWRCPAQRYSINIDGGNVAVMFQGRTLDRYSCCCCCCWGGGLIWLPAANPALGLKEQLQPQKVLVRPLEREEQFIREIRLNPRAPGETQKLARLFEPDEE